MSSSFVIILVVSLGLLATCQGDLIADFCSESNNPSLCNQVLRSDPRSRGENPQTLALIALEKSESAIKDAVDVAKSVKNATNVEKIKTCLETFDNAIGNFEDCRPVLPKCDRLSISDLQTYGSSALTNIDTCSDEFGAGEPPQLKAASDKAYTLAQLFLIIVNTFKSCNSIINE